MPLNSLSKKQKIGITSPFALLAIAHLLWPKLGIDATTIVLIILASIPWILPYIKSFDLAGIGKIELNDMKAATNKIALPTAELKSDDKGLSENSIGKNQALSDKLFFADLRRIAEVDPNLPLVGFRIELERRILSLAKRLEIPIEKKSLGLIVVQLEDKGILAGYMFSGLMELIRLGNLAAHGDKVNKNAIDWVLNIGPQIFQDLDGINKSNLTRSLS